MRVVLAYVFPNIGSRSYEDMAARFASHYVSNPPGESDHELWVIVNGSQITDRQEKLFEPLSPQYLYHDNSGKDVGAHRLAAAKIPCDLIVFLGAPCWPGKPCWLDRIVKVWQDTGPALFGNYCFHAPAPHVRTTFYWCPPQIINSHSLPVDNGLRYEWEHGSKSITRHAMKLGFPVIQVLWNHVLPFEKWTHVTEDECLQFDQHTERMGYGFGR